MQINLDAPKDQAERNTVPFHQDKSVWGGGMEGRHKRWGIGGLEMQHLAWIVVTGNKLNISQQRETPPKRANTISGLIELLSKTLKVTLLLSDLLSPLRPNLES